MSDEKPVYRDQREKFLQVVSLNLKILWGQANEELSKAALTAMENRKNPAVFERRAAEYDGLKEDITYYERIAQQVREMQPPVKAAPSPNAQTARGTVVIEPPAAQ
jgi:hypothetical protein